MPAAHLNELAQNSLGQVYLFTDWYKDFHSFVHQRVFASHRIASEAPLTKPQITLYKSILNNQIARMIRLWWIPKSQLRNEQLKSKVEQKSLTSENFLLLFLKFFSTFLELNGF